MNETADSGTNRCPLFLSAYFSFAKAFDCPVNEDRLYNSREQVAEAINEILLHRLRSNIRFCARSQIYLKHQVGEPRYGVFQGRDHRLQPVPDGGQVLRCPDEAPVVHSKPTGPTGN